MKGGSYDSSKPDGAPYKTVDGSRGKALLGWSPQIGLGEGLTDCEMVPGKPGLA